MLADFQNFFHYRILHEVAGSDNQDAMKGAGPAAKDGQTFCTPSIRNPAFRTQSVLRRLRLGTLG